MKAAVIGAGSWGTALAAVLAENDRDTILWSKRHELSEEINTNHSNSKYLPGASLPVSLRATTELSEALNNANLVVIAVPSAAVLEVIRFCKPWIPDNAVIAHAVKGFELETRRRISDVLQAELPDVKPRLAVICGPSHAEEVIRNMPTTIVVAAFQRSTAEQVQDALMNSSLRVYTNPDVIGAELGGCLKNIIALGVGMADGLGFGDNAKAALMTRGIAEISRLGTKLGAAPLTFAGLSGVGDLIATCTSHHSRNFRAGRLMGLGHTLESALAQIGMAVEGVRTTQAALEIAREAGVEMPIAEAVSNVIFHRKAPSCVVEDLMGRERGHEIEEVARHIVPPTWM